MGKFHKPTKYGKGIRKQGEQYQAVVSVGKTRINLGSFNTVEEAKAAQQKYKDRFPEAFNKKKGKYIPEHKSQGKSIVRETI